LPTGEAAGDGIEQVKTHRHRNILMALFKLPQIFHGIILNAVHLMALFYENAAIISHAIYSIYTLVQLQTGINNNVSKLSRTMMNNSQSHSQ
jgi:hypothetical protein